MTIAQIIGLIIVLLIAGFLGFLIVKKSEKHDLVKWLGLFFFVAAILSWFIAPGYYAGATFQNISEKVTPIGFADANNIVSYGFQAVYAKLVFLLAVGAFYGVFSKTKSYGKLVSTLSAKIKGKEIIFVLIASLLFVAMGSIFTSSLIALVFVPFVISVILNAKMDKIVAFATTFGSLLVGVMGATFGFEGIKEFNYYISMYSGSEIVLNKLVQLLVLVIGFVLLNVFNIRRIKKLSKSKINESQEDPYMIEKTDKNASIVPSIVILAFLLVISILGYVPWADAFKIDVFTKFHEWLIALSIKDFAVFSAILGSSSLAFGAWDYTVMPIILIILSLIVIIIDRKKFDELLSLFGSGVKVMLLPAILIVGVQSMIYIANFSPTIPVIVNAIIDGIKNFNPYIVSFVAFIGSIFQPDLGFNALTLGSYYVTSYADNAQLIQTIFVTVSGLLGFVVPTNILLVTGLSYLKIEFKSWIKFIWLFALILVVLLIILYSVLAYLV